VAPAGLARWNLVLMGSGFGALAIIAWEGVEWIIQEMGTTGLELTYDDTVGDLLLSTAGGVLGALVTANLLARRSADSSQVAG
jgi:glycopeptide antibiotics resistance protein